MRKREGVPEVLYLRSRWMKVVTAVVRFVSAS